MNRRSGRAGGASPAWIGLLFLGACSTGAQPDQMSVANGGGPGAVAGARSYHALSIGQIGGGSQTNPLWYSSVSNEDLRAALQASLRNLNYLADGGTGAYVVTADLVDLDRPALAVDPVLIIAPVEMTVTAKIHYVVKPVGGGAPVFDEVVATTGTGAGDSALTSDGRVRKGVEAAVKANIAEFVSRLRTEWN